MRIERSDDMASAIREAGVDLVAGIDGNDTVASTLGLSLSAPYMTTNLLLVYNRFVDPDDLSNRKLALSWELESALPANDSTTIYGRWRNASRP